ncbi:MAG: S8 family serine peptidase [Thermoanaerobaculia bacterium]
MVKVLAAALTVCTVVLEGLAQTSPGAAELIARFPELSRTEETTDFIPDPLIRRATGVSELEQRYDMKLGDLVAAEQQFATKKVQVETARQDVIRADEDVRRAEERLRDAEADYDVFGLMDALPNVDASASAAGAATEVQKAQTALLKARQELTRKKNDTVKLEGQLVEAEKSLRDAATETTAVQNERREWIDQNEESEEEQILYDGALTERDVILVQFADGVQPSRITEILDEHHLQVRSGIADIRLFITRLTDTHSTEPFDVSIARLRRTILRLNRHPEVIAASQNVLIGGEIVPKAGDLTFPLFCWEWHNDACSGIRGAKRLRLPSAWNVMSAIERRNGPPIRVAVLDEGFAPHTDLKYMSICSPISELHGTQVLGVIAAEWGNGKGIDGVTPFADVLACAPGRLAARTPRGMAVVMSRVLWTFHQLVATRRPRVVNISLGYNWVAGFDDAMAGDARADVRLLVRAHGLYARSLMRFFPDVIAVSAAGNECTRNKCAHDPCQHQAKWSNPFNWAALENEGTRSPNVFVVDSIDAGTQLSTFSCRGGHIGAPGEGVMTTMIEPQNEMEANHLAPYGADSGTSRAAPAVTGIVAFLLAYTPGLSPREIANALQIGANPRPIADAFDALVRSAPERVFHDLADLNNDGVVDDTDYVRFRKDLREVESGLVSDLNEDGNPDQNDGRFPRADLNGDGVLDRNKKSFVFKLGDVTDLQVMEAAWQDRTKGPTKLFERLDE